MVVRLGSTVHVTNELDYRKYFKVKLQDII